MELRPPAAAIDDPFFGAVRRRHPDVDVVLLPPADPPGAAAPEPAGDDLVAATLIRVATQTRQVWSAVAPGADEEPDVRVGFGADPASVRAVARVVARRDDGFEVLVRLRHKLESHGWELRRPRGSGVERLTGVLGPSRRLVPRLLRTGKLDLTASYAEQSGTLILTVTSESLSVGGDRARELTLPPDQHRGER